MTNDTMDNRLEMRWVPVVDPRGRTHMEARWVLTADALSPAHVTPHAA